jgi:hypothetical protein
MTVMVMYEVANGGHWTGLPPGPESLQSVGDGRGIVGPLGPQRAGFPAGLY